MALTPENNIFLADEQTEIIQPSKTWTIDFETGRIGKFTDGVPAVKQFIRKALLTARNKYLIYTDQYGNELHDLIGEDVTEAFLSAEIPRMVQEAIIYDDRIEETQVEYERRSDKLFITVKATLAIGEEITEEVELNAI